MDYGIVAFGDGNTRYFLGDENKHGPAEYAWPAQMEDILCALGVKATVRNEGCPGEPAAFARAEFDRVTVGAQLCILGFGTEDIRRLDHTMAGYLAEMEEIVHAAQRAGVSLIILGIPWFEETWAGALAQTRLPKWNRALEALCERCGVPFLDLYTAFRDDPERWFNECETPKRHLSVRAQRRVAELALPLVLGYIR